MIPPDDWSSLLLVGQDKRGRWLVQDTAGRIEGHFLSRETALHFARAERDLLHATVRFADAPLTARVA
jgi:hypothetical protein